MTNNLETRIREGVFETNSSSTHAFSISRGKVDLEAVKSYIKNDKVFINLDTVYGDVDTQSFTEKLKFLMCFCFGGDSDSDNEGESSHFMVKILNADGDYEIVDVSHDDVYNFDCFNDTDDIDKLGSWDKADGYLFVEILKVLHELGVKYLYVDDHDYDNSTDDYWEQYGVESSLFSYKNNLPYVRELLLNPEAYIIYTEN